MIWAHKNAIIFYIILPKFLQRNSLQYVCVFLANFQLFQIIKLFPGAKLKNKRLIWQVSTHSSLPSNMRSQFQIYMKESSLMSDKKSWLCIRSWVYYIIFFKIWFFIISNVQEECTYITLLGNECLRLMKWHSRIASKYLEKYKKLCSITVFFMLLFILKISIIRQIF